MQIFLLGSLIHYTITTHQQSSMNCSTANNIPFCVYCISTSTYGGGGAAKAACGGDVYGSCLEISIADVATTVLERPFSCLEILVHWNRLRAGSSSELPLPTTAAAPAAAAAYYAASCLLASACLPAILPACPSSAVGQRRTTREQMHEKHRQERKLIFVGAHTGTLAYVSRAKWDTFWRVPNSKVFLQNPSFNFGRLILLTASNNQFRNYQSDFARIFGPKRISCCTSIFLVI